MLEEQEPSQGRSPRQEQRARDGRNQLNFQSGRDINVRAPVAGRDVHVGDNVHGNKVTIIKRAHRWPSPTPCWPAAW
ncbi:hypothetical protein ACIA6T_14740 [Streptomyces sp. NPDC051740]|uniref:hypothetical protein n=1 Tax=Streptomyces sp. NPDC051740 TaxID=3365673 RepID=UPI0037AAECC5